VAFPRAAGPTIAFVLYLAAASSVVLSFTHELCYTTGKLNTYLDDHVAIERVIDGGDRIAVIGRGSGTIKSTGRDFDVSIMHLWGFQDGLAVRLEIVLDVPAMQAALAP
jgi:ketosteroid isomerase-like protein